MSDPRFVEYRGQRMIEGWPEKIQEAQTITHALINGARLERIAFGAERDDWGANEHPCQDCRVFKGEYHVPGCDAEECPSCHDQLLSCDCEVEDSDAP